MPDELHSCPFCGDEGLLHRVPWGWQVSCEGCGAAPRSNSNSNRETEEGAVAVWNTRAALQSSQPREEGIRDPWNPDPEDPFWMLEIRQGFDDAGSWLKNDETYLTTRDPVKALRFPSRFAAECARRRLPGEHSGRFEPTDHSWITAPIEQENTEEREQIAENANCSTAEAQSRSPVEDALVEKVARAISGTQWDRACSALGTPNYPRGDNWSALLPEARAAIEALSQSPAIDPRVEELIRTSDDLGMWMSAALDDPKVCEAMKSDIDAWLTALAAFGGRTE